MNLLTIISGYLAIIMIESHVDHHDHLDDIGMESSMAYDGTICDKPICEYTWEIRRFCTMTYYDGTDSYDVILNGTQLMAAENFSKKKADYPIIGSVLSSDDVITGDGYKRDIITINDKFPGPDIHVISGSQVVVHVWNRMSLESTTIHWHGVHQLDTPWMDGVPYITQCPIQPSHKFTYRFMATPHGTRWYHSHLEAQRADGLYGMLIIYPSIPPTPHFIFTVNDWLHADAVSYEFQNPNSMTKPGTGELLERDHMSMVRFFGALINGRGRWNDEKYPLEEFKVTHGQTHRFRVGAVGQEYSLEISIDSHKLNIVALDGVDINPIEVDSFMIHAGETLDFELMANQPPLRYWLRVVAIKNSLGTNPSLDDPDLGVKAILVYDGASTYGDPQTSPTVCSGSCKVFNCPAFALPVEHHRVCIGIEQATSTAESHTLVNTYGLTEPDHDIIEYFWNFGFTVGSSVNSRRYVPSRAPLYRADVDEYITECVEDVCDTEGCKCTYIENIPLNRTIQIVMTNLSPPMGAYMPANDKDHTGHHRVRRTDHKDHMEHSGMSHHHHTHPHIIHLHGHSMAVVKVAYPVHNETTGRWIHDNQDVECYGKSPEMCTKLRWAARRPELNQVNPAIKNTVLVPPGGYLVVRFRSDNPGFWFLHCHMTQHLLDGMAMVLNEGPGRHPPLPSNFPDCHDFKWSQRQHNDYVTAAREMRRESLAMAKYDTIVSDAHGHDHHTMSSDDSHMDHMVQMPVSTAIGAAFGFIFLGALLPVITVIIYLCYMASRRYAPPFGARVDTF